MPGHGDIGTIDDVKEFGGYLVDLRALVSEAETKKKGGDDLVSAVLPEVAKKYESWEFFKYFAKSNIKDMDSELRGAKRKPGDPKTN